MSSVLVDSPVAQLRCAVDGLLSADLSVFPSAAITDLLVEVEVQKRRLAALDVAALTQIRDRSIAAEHCRSSPADLLVALLRVTPGEAKARMLAAEDLGPRLTLSGEVLEPILPRVAQAVAAGEISPAQVSVIGKALDRIPADIAVEAVPVAEQFLLAAARHEHPRALDRTAQLLLARLDPDGPEPHEPAERRGFGLRRRASGWSSPYGNLDPATTAAVETVLDSLSAPAPAQDGTADPRSPGQRRHDALFEVARRLLRSGSLPPAGGVPATVIVTSTAREWSREGLAATTRGEWWSVRDLRGCPDQLCEAEIVHVLTTGAGAPLALKRTRRLASASQRVALIARDAGCCFPGCDRPPAWTEAHHVIAWQDGGPTDIDNLCLLCSFHHREFTRRGWAVRIAADGLPEWLPPAWIDAERKPVRNRAHHHDEIDFGHDHDPPLEAQDEAT